jgi:hypothetical protein
MPKSVTFGACVATVFASLTIPGMAARADDCLAAPNRTAGPGTHWASRVDRAANRRCWYLVDAAGHPAPPPDGDSIGTFFSKWLTGENNPPDPHAAPAGRTDDTKPHPPRPPDTQASLNPKPHKPPAPHPVADPPANQTDSDALFRQFLRWKERQSDKERRPSEQTQQ